MEIHHKCENWKVLLDNSYLLHKEQDISILFAQKIVTSQDMHKKLMQVYIIQEKAELI